ncbi:MAG: DUF3987 domain-containing protein [Oscillatoriaceae cyanobacterium Prado104]|jgi:CRISPR-associated protein Cmr3|nr:DUF3987 domain-containing protein [Oscillatoriaceae cyanobacterium Prado104]
MYLDDTSDFASKLARVSKTNPCPHCGKPDWCYGIGNLSVCKRQSPPASGWEATSKCDAEGTPYYAPIQEKKAIRPRQTRYWEYPARDGSPLVRVKRIDFGDGQRQISQESWDGKCWVGKVKGIVDRADIPPYCYAEVRQAIAENKLIFIAEGEPCADALRELELTATTNIGGALKWQPSDTSDLTGAQVVIVLDRDQPGLKRAALLSQEFPDALWLYPYPNSPIWNNPPASDGLDVADWIASHKLTKEEIIAAVGERKQMAAPPTAKILEFPKSEAPSLENLATEIDELLTADLKRSQLRTKLAGLAQKFRLNPSEVEKIYRDREQELEQEADREDVATEVARLLGSQSASLKLSEILPDTLAEPIQRLAAMLNLRKESYLLALLTQCSSLLKNGTSLMAYPQSNLICRPNYFGVLVADSSQKKSPILKAIISGPMEKLWAKSEQEYERAQAVYEEELAQWSADKKNPDKGPMPKPPAQKIYSFTEATFEGIATQVQKMPEQGMLWIADELAGAFKSANQYRGGRGGDEEKLLGYWSGVGETVLRASGLKANVRSVGLSIFGGIQPKVLAGFLGDGSDDNGKFARFDFIHQPLTATELHIDAPRIDLTPMLTALYEKLDSLPVRQFEFDREARKMFLAFYNHCGREFVSHPKQGMRAMWGKAAEKVGKLALVLHCIHAGHNGVEISQTIGTDIVRAAIKFVNFTIGQALSLNLELCEPNALAPNLAKILLLAERKGGMVSARDVSKNFSTYKSPLKTEQVREWFGELAKLKYGEVTTKGRNISFTLSPHSHSPQSTPNPSTTSDWVPPNNNSDFPHSPQPNELSGGKCRKVPEHSPHLKTLPDNALKAIGGNAGKNSPPLQNSNGLMMSCTTGETPPEPPIGPVQNHPPLPEFEVGDRVEIGGSSTEHYNGVTGKIVNVYFGGSPIEQWQYVVEFDAPIRNSDFSTFTAGELEELAEQ